MTPEQFVYWLQGYFELSGSNAALNEVQTEIVKDHLKLVFKKETLERTHSITISPPSQPVKRGGPFPTPVGLRDEEFGAIKSPLGDIPNWEGSC